MKKVLSLTLILLSAFVSFAQTPADWQKFSPDGEEFIVEVPQKLKESVKFRQVDEKKYDFASADYRKYFNGVFYFISTNSLPSNNVSLPFLYGQLSSFVNEFDKAPETIKFGDFNGIKYEFKDSEDFHHTIIFIKTNNRVYKFHTVQEESVSDDAKRFLKSIHLFQEILKPRVYGENIQIINLGDLFNYNSSSEKKADQNQPVTKDSADITPLKITTKPRASYTDLARLYELQGSVAVTVEFLSNGEIGKIIPVKRLPFGLTQSVVDAVRRIKFEPAKKDGEAFTVTKRLIYSFTLY